MQLEYSRKHSYELIEESKIETEGGALYRAQDLQLKRTLAVKCVRIEGNSYREKQLFLERAMSEVRAMVSLGEENICIPRIFDTFYDEKKGRLFIMMEWIKGKTLAQSMDAPELAFLQWMIDLCEILSVMERRHIYHKDIKPANIMLTERGKLYLIDFNISISTPNLVEGTLHYKAPEMAENSRYQGREKVDLFAVGVMLYEYYTGNVPVRGVDYAKNRSRGAFAWDKFTAPIEKNPSMSETVNAIIVKCMLLDPRQRYRNASDLKNELMKAVRTIRWEQKKKR